MTDLPTLDHQEILKVELEQMVQEHADLDHAIDVMRESGKADQLTIRRFKKKKLALKDQIARLEDELYPDIIA